MKKGFNDNSAASVPQDSGGSIIPSVRGKDGAGSDVISLLLKHRVILVDGPVRTDMATVVNAQLFYLADLDKEAPVEMQINSPGGSIYDGLAIVDAMRFVKCPIHTRGIGMEASMGSVILVAGKNRKMTENAKLLLHQGLMDPGYGQHTDIALANASLANLIESIKNIYAEYTGLNHEFWDAICERDTWLSAEEALEIGFIDGITKVSEGSKGRYAADRLRKNEGIFSAVDKTICDYIAQMPKEEVLKELNNPSAQKGAYASLRSKLVVRLSKFPEYWTDTKRIENGLQPVDESNSANDNQNSAEKTVKRTPKSKGDNPSPTQGS